MVGKVQLQIRYYLHSTALTGMLSSAKDLQVPGFKKIDV